MQAERGVELAAPCGKNDDARFLGSRVGEDAGGGVRESALGRLPGRCGVWEMERAWVGLARASLFSPSWSLQRVRGCNGCVGAMGAWVHGCIG